MSNFDYKTFYRFYTDTNNLLPNTSSHDVYYYLKPEQLRVKPLPAFHIVINNIVLYVSWDDKGSLYFSTPWLKDGKYWDNHFHFALNDKFTNAHRKIPNTPMVSFAKTIQIPDKYQKDNKVYKCNFRDKVEDLTKIAEIICTNLSVCTTMKEKIKSDDLSILEELLVRPFISYSTVGGNVRYQKRRCKVYIGSRGGKYVIVKNRKVYVKTHINI